MNEMKAIARMQRGMTLIELIIVATLLFLLAGAVASMTIRGHDAQRYAARSVQLNGLTHDLIEMVRKDVSGSTRFFVNNTEGTSYLAGMDTSSATPYTTVLPELSSTGIFEKDSITSAKTGNALFFALLDRTDTYDIGTLTPQIVRTDIFRFVIYYMRTIGTADPTTETDALDLVKWVSEPIADWTQVEAITDPVERETLLLHLYNGDNPQNASFPYPRVRWVWRQGEVFAAAFNQISASGALGPVPAGFKVPLSTKRSKLRILETNRFAIATNLAPSTRGIARFGILDNTGVGFPHGFEVQVIGPASARQILIHLTTVSRESPKHRTWIDLVGVAETRDL